MAWISEERSVCYSLVCKACDKFDTPEFENFTASAYKGQLDKARLHAAATGHVFMLYKTEVNTWLPIPDASIIKDMQIVADARRRMLEIGQVKEAANLFKLWEALRKKRDEMRKIDEGI